MAALFSRIDGTLPLHRLTVWGYFYGCAHTLCGQLTCRNGCTGILRAILKNRRLHLHQANWCQLRLRML